MFFSTLPAVAEGFRLKTWGGGLEAGKPKIPPVAKGLPERDQLFHVRVLRAVQRVAAEVPHLWPELPKQARRCRDFKLCGPLEPFGLRRVVRT